MATYHSLNIALGLLPDGFVKGLATAGSALRKFTTGGLNLQGALKFATAAYGTTRAVDAIGEGSRQIADNLRAARGEGDALVATFDSMSLSADRVGTNIQRFGFVVGGIKSGWESLRDWWNGVGQRDPKADAAAEAAKQANEKQQTEWQARLARFDELKKSLSREQDLARLGPRGRRVTQGILDLGLDKPRPEDLQLLAESMVADMDEKRAALSRKNAERRIGRSLSVLADSQRAPSGGGLGVGGSTPALLLGSREEYVARMKAMQRSDPEKKDERRDRKELVRAQKEANKWLRKILDAQGALSIPGGV